ncbi:MAG: AEC family transporter [Eubacteriales bacterium]
MDFTNLLNLQIMMFIMMGIGAILRKLNIIKSEDKTVITELVINLLLPCSIVMAFYIEFSSEILQQGFLILIISCVLHLFCLFLSKILFNKYDKDQKVILQYGTICSNAGFLGNPIAEGVYGSLGLLYASIYLLPLRIIIWSAGLSYYTETTDKKMLVKKVATHPCIVTVFLGMLLMITQVQLPTAISNTLSSLGSCSTPFTMLLIGVILAEGDMKTMITKTTVKFSILRLILIPMAVFVACKLAGVPELIAGVSILLAAMPAGTTTAILAVKYNRDAEFATKCVVLTTILSMVMIPIWCMIIGMWY